MDTPADMQTQRRADAYVILRARYFDATEIQLATKEMFENQAIAKHLVQRQGRILGTMLDVCRSLCRVEKMTLQEQRIYARVATELRKVESSPGEFLKLKQTTG
jgi:hypothetical protein